MKHHWIMACQLDSYSMLICSKYVNSISDMINITLVNSKFKDNIDKLHSNPFQINQNSRKYFINLQTQWLFDINDDIFTDGDISGYYINYEISYDDYLTMKDKYQNIKFRRIIYTKKDRLKYGDEIPFGVKKLDNYLYCFSDIEEIKIPDSIVEIGRCCFYFCKSLTSITISSRLTNIGERVFYNCHKLQSITLPSVLTFLNNGLFQWCSELTTITIPSNVIRFERSIFANGFKLKEVELPNNMMQLSDRMFFGCNNLTKINIPSSITRIGKAAFKGCVQLQTITGNVDVCVKFKKSFKNTPLQKQLKGKNGCVVV